MLIVFLDVTNAFDHIYHDGLLYKLQAIGVRCSLLTWFQSYLTDRKQRVVIKAKESSWRKVNAGVHQGSILGPLLCLIYVSDMTEGVISDFSAFADDTSLIRPLKDPNDIQTVNGDLEQLTNWAKQWRMEFNMRKTVYMVISKKFFRPPDIDLYLDAVKLSRVYSIVIEACGCRITCLAVNILVKLLQRHLFH